MKFGHSVYSSYTEIRPIHDLCHDATGPLLYTPSKPVRAIVPNIHSTGAPSGYSAGPRQGQRRECDITNFDNGSPPHTICIVPGTYRSLRFIYSSKFSSQTLDSPHSSFLRSTIQFICHRGCGSSIADSVKKFICTHDLTSIISSSFIYRYGTGNGKRNLLWNLNGRISLMDKKIGCVHFGRLCFFDRDLVGFETILSRLWRETSNVVSMEYK